MNAVVPERISQARELAGLSKTDLAEKLNVSVAAVTQWESGAKNPTTDNILAISYAVGVPMFLLLTPIPQEVSRRGPLTFRARVDAKTTRLRKQAHRFAELSAEAFLWLENWVSFPVAALPENDHPSDPELAATNCRRAWGLGDRPITKLGELLESKGIRLCSAQFGSVKMDAYSCVLSGRSFVFLRNELQDRARTRFDLSHELGHLILHQHFSDEDLDLNEKEIEKEANRFAGAFLLPKETFSADLTDSSLNGFKRLKPKWGVSIQMMVFRAKELGLISEDTYKSHFRSIGMRGWRKPGGEPLDELVPATVRSLGAKSLELLEASNKIKPWEISGELPLPEDVLTSVFGRNVREMLPNEFSNVIVLGDFDSKKGIASSTQDPVSS